MRRFSKSIRFGNETKSRLRFGALIRRTTAAATGMAALLILSPAAAEVCDKVVGEHWRPSDGPLPLILVYMPWVIPLGLLCFFLLGIFGGGPLRVAAAELNWLGYLCAVLVAVIVVLDLGIATYPDEVVIGAIQEGCISLRVEWNGGFVMAVVALLLGMTAYRAKRLQRIDVAKTAH